MGKYVSAEQIADYSRDGVVCIKGLFKDWVPVISAGIERNMREPSRYAAENLKPGEGAIQIVQKAFGPATATVVAGADPAGTDVASMYLARRVPYLWDVTSGSFGLDDVTEPCTKNWRRHSYCRCPCTRLSVGTGTAGACTS